MKRQAFTLIELLVVIAILGLLAALLFPVFVKVRENGRRTACLSNERQIGMAIQQYINDNDGLFNFGGSSIEGKNWALGSADWASLCLPYLKDVRLYQCPDDPSKVTHSNTPPQYPVSYAINSNLHGAAPVASSSSWHHYQDANESVLVSPAQTVLLCEVTGSHTSDQSYQGVIMDFSASGNGGHDCGFDGAPRTYPCGEFLSDPQSGPIPVPTYATGNIGGRVLNGSWLVTDEAFPQHVSPGSKPRHGAVSVYLACDGHVRWLRPDQVSGGQSQPTTGPACGQDDTSAGCGGNDTSAGTANSKYALTFSIR